MTKSQRWMKLLNEIEQRPGQTAEQLAERFGCSVRTIQRDIESLPEFGLSVRNRKGYRFDERDQARTVNLNREEVLAIALAEKAARRQLDETSGAVFSQIVSKVQRSSS